MIELGKAISGILENGTTSLVPHPDFAKNETGDNYIVYSIRNNTPSDTKSGASTLDEVDVNIRIYSKSVGKLSDMSTKVRADLDRLAHGTYYGVDLNGVQYQDEDTNFDPFTKRYENEQTYVFRVKR